MKKVLFGMALVSASFAVNAQQLMNAEGKTATTSSAKIVKGGEAATNLQTRITRVLALDPATSAKVGEVTAEYYQKTQAAELNDASLAKLKAERESKLKDVLGAEKYTQLNEYRTKLKANMDNPQVVGRGGSVDKVLLD